MNEDEYIYYNEWAENELLWGRGMYNWCRAYDDNYWNSPAEDTDYLLRKDLKMYKDLKDYPDSELMYLLRIAIETRDGRYIKAIRKELDRRCKNE